MALDYSLFHVKSLRGSIANKAAFEAFEEVYRNRTPEECIGQSGITDFDQGILAIDQHTEELLGFISYYPWNNDQAYYVTMAFVDTQFRRNGIHTALFNALVKQAEENGVTLIQSGANISNKASVESQTAQGRNLEGYIFTYYPKRKLTPIEL